MASALLFNRARVATATTGTGTVTLGAKVSNKYATFAEAGVVNAQVVTYTIEDGNDWEIGRGTYTSSGTTLSRDTVLNSSVGGTVGTSKLNLSGAAEVFITAAKEDFDVNDFTEDTSPDGAADFHWMHDASATLKKKVKPTNLKQTGGFQLLTSGTLASAATLPLVLTSYTAFKMIKILLMSWIPATDDTMIEVNFSTNGGSSYDAAASNYLYWASYSESNNAVTSNNSTGDTKIQIGRNTGTQKIGNLPDEGLSCEFLLWDPFNTALRTRCNFRGVYMPAVGPTNSYSFYGHGVRSAVQDTDAIQFKFNSGNIATGFYAVLGAAF